MSLEIMTSIDLNENSVTGIPDNIQTVGGKKMHALDDALSGTSENPVQNKAIKTQLDTLDAKIDAKETPIDGYTIKKGNQDKLYGVGYGVVVNGLTKGELFNVNANGSPLPSGLGSAAGERSHGEGLHPIADGDYSHAEGYYGTTTGMASHAEGNTTTASGDSSHSEGNNTVASGTSAHAEGQSQNVYNSETYGSTEDEIYSSWLNSNRNFAVSSGVRAHSEGYNCIALRLSAHAEGEKTCAKGSYSHSEGYMGVAYGHSSHVEGYGQTTFGQGAHAEGYTESSPPSTFPTDTKKSLITAWRTSSFSLAYGIGSHIEGSNTFAYGTNSHSEGTETRAEGASSHSEGGGTCATGLRSHAEGSGTSAYGDYSHAEGNGTEATGQASHAEGLQNTATGTGCHVEGVYNEATGAGAHVSGIYNSINGISSTSSGSLNTSTITGSYCSFVTGQRNHINNYSIAIGTNLMVGDGVCVIGSANHRSGSLFARDMVMIYETNPSSNNGSLIYNQNYAIVKKDALDNVQSLVMCVAGNDPSLAKTEIQSVMVNDVPVDPQYYSLSPDSGIAGQKNLDIVGHYYLIIDVGGFIVDSSDNYTIRVTTNGSLGDINVFSIGNGPYAADEDCDDLHRANALEVTYNGNMTVQNNIYFKYKDSSNNIHRISAQKMVNALLSLGINISDLEVTH